MKTLCALCALTLTAASAPAIANGDVYFGVGDSKCSDLRSSADTFGGEKFVSEHFGVGLMYLNEGHLDTVEAKYHRDGFALQGIAYEDITRSLRASLSFGPYYSMNTPRTLQDEGKMGDVVTAALQYRFLFIRYNYVNVSSSIKTKTLLVGVSASTQNDVAVDDSPELARLVYLEALTGFSWATVGVYPRAVAHEVALEETLNEDFRVSVGYLSEGDTVYDRRQGAVARLWYDARLDFPGSPTVGAALGSYLAHDQVTRLTRVDPSISFEMFYHLTRDIETGVQYTRIHAVNKIDADLLQFGVRVRI